MQLSVIILNYNVSRFLEQCLLSVTRALKNINSEIIVVDNASADDSCTMVKEKFPEVILIENTENLGFPKGNNIGVAKAKGEYICILNPDTVVAENTFNKILSIPFEAKNIGIVGCKLIDGSGSFLPESKRGIPTPWVAFTKIFGLYKIFPKNTLFNQYYAQHISKNVSEKTAILVGAFMVMKKELYLKLGGFDENCFMYSDDIDLSYLSLQNNKENYYFSQTTVIHYKGESTVRDKKYIRRFKEAMQFFYKKHFKRNTFFDISMEIGSFIFSTIKKNQQKNSKKNIDEYIIFSTKKIAHNFSVKTKYFTDFKQFKNTSTHKNIEIIFNIDNFSFLEIITFMEQHRATNISFKNYIPQSNFIIGSYNSNDKGEVIIL